MHYKSNCLWSKGCCCNSMLLQFFKRLKINRPVWRCLQEEVISPSLKRTLSSRESSSCLTIYQKCTSWHHKYRSFIVFFTPRLIKNSVTRIMDRNLKNPCCRRVCGLSWIIDEAPQNPLFSVFIFLVIYIEMLFEEKKGIWCFSIKNKFLKIVLCLL